MSSTIDLSAMTPLTVHEFKLFAPAKVNGADSLAYLDTGANWVTISPQLAEAMPRVGTTTVRSAFEGRTYETVENIEIAFLGDARLTTALVTPVLDDGDQPPFVANIKLDAPTIFDKPLIFDFRLLSVSRPKQRGDEMWLTVPARFVEDKGICLLELASRSGPITALFDTGAGLSVLNSARIERGAFEFTPAFELEIGDATGAKATQRVARCSGLRVESIVVPDFHCFLTDLRAIEKALGCDIHMVFGANAMLRSGLSWLIDKPNEEVLFTA